MEVRGMKYRYWLANVTGIGNVTKSRLVGCMGSAKAVYRAKKLELLETGLVAQGIADYLLEQRKSWDLKRECEAFVRRGIGLVTIEEEAYPALLRGIHNAPYALYYLGTLPKADEKMVAMVGARRCSAYGRTMAEELAAALAKAGYSVVSGMAMGIDGAAHCGCLRGGGRSYAFLGCGVDVVYPRQHRPLYQELIAHGAVLSDYPPGTKPLPVHFPARNRLIAGMAQKTLVIEARAKSGSLITADLAMEQGRDVLALPGRVTDPMSEGTNRLIAQGAGIICGITDLVADMTELSGLDALTGKGAPGHLNLEKDELLVYSCFDFYAKGIEEVRRECGMELMPLLSAVMRLCELGLLKETFKNQYIRMG